MPPWFSFAVPRPRRGIAAGRVVAVILLAGFLVGLLMVLRSQAGGDQLNLLARGWLFAEQGRWVPYGNPTSAGGVEPGGLTALLVGLPLLVWQDYRAPALLILFTHVLAFLLLDRSLAPLVGPRGRVIFAVAYWLNPWQLYFAGFLWNPNWLFLCGAAHTWSSVAQRREGRFWASFVHVVALGAALELHASFVILVLASVLLVLRGYLKLDWRGALTAGILVAVSLVPWVVTVAHDPALFPAHRGFLGRGLVTVFPLLRGVLYWLRYPSFLLPADMVDFDFTATLGPAWDALLARPLYVAAQLLGLATLALAVLANWRLARRNPQRWLRRPTADIPGREWLRGYVLWFFIAAVIGFALAPTTVMTWQTVLVMHVAILPLVLWLVALGRTRRAATVRRGVAAGAGVAFALSIAIAFGAPIYRPGGRGAVDITVEADHPMWHALHLYGRTNLAVDAQHGYWPDVLRHPAAATPENR
jgi:hypothetical protein